MNYLIDTHTFIWAISHPHKLSKPVREIITNGENSIFVSVISFWEVALKVSIKKFSFEGVVINKLPEYAQEMGFHVLDLHAQESCTFADLPIMDNHKDPFDRMIIWQAITRNMKLISKDGLFEQYKKYDLQLIW
jgi:PIN domain nuclease of toxin-antitoxin system